MLERVDARVDDPEDALDACRCPAARWPGDLSARELAVALARTAPDAPLTIVPISGAARRAAERLGTLLEGAWPGTGAVTPAPRVVPFDEAPAALSEGSGPTVLVVRSGETARSLAAVSARLRLLERPPAFVVVCRGK